MTTGVHMYYSTHVPRYYYCKSSIMSSTDIPDMRTQQEIKSAIKSWLKRIGKDYKWLAELLGKARSTLANYLALKPMPRNLIEQVSEVMKKYPDGDNPVKKRNRRTREQIRKDNEEAMRRGQAEMEANGGFIDEDATDRKWRQQGEKALCEYQEMTERAVLERRLDDVLDAEDVETLQARERTRAGKLASDAQLVPGVYDSPVTVRAFDAVPSQERVNVSPYGSTFLITLPEAIVRVYLKEAKWISEQVDLVSSHDLLPRMIARAIVSEARAISNSPVPYYNDILDKQMDAILLHDKEDA